MKNSSLKLMPEKSKALLTIVAVSFLSITAKCTEKSEEVGNTLSVFDKHPVIYYSLVILGVIGVVAIAYFTSINKSKRDGESNSSLKKPSYYSRKHRLHKVH